MNGEHSDDKCARTSKQKLIDALQPFAEIGSFLFARDLPDDTPMIEVRIVNGRTTLTRGDFKAASLAYRALMQSDETSGDIETVAHPTTGRRVMIEIDCPDVAIDARWVVGHWCGADWWTGIPGRWIKIEDGWRVLRWRDLPQINAVEPRETSGGTSGEQSVKTSVGLGKGADATMAAAEPASRPEALQSDDDHTSSPPSAAPRFSAESSTSAPEDSVGSATERGDAQIECSICGAKRVNEDDYCPGCEAADLQRHLKASDELPSQAAVIHDNGDAYK